MVAQWYCLRLVPRETRVPTLPDAYFHYQDALDWRTMDKRRKLDPLCRCRFDRAVMVAQWYCLRLVPRETRVRTLPWASSGHVTTITRSPLRQRSPMLTFATKMLLTGSQWTKGGNKIPFRPRSFDQAVMVAQLYGLRLVPRETRVRTLPWASSGHVTTITRSLLRRRSPMLTVATKMLSTGAQWTKEGN
jgi:hypothetical protein